MSGTARIELCQFRPDDSSPVYDPCKPVAGSQRQQRRRVCENRGSHHCGEYAKRIAGDGRVLKTLRLSNCICTAMLLDLLQSLHIMHPRNLTHAIDDGLQVLEVGDFEDHVDAGLSVAGAGLDVTDISALVGYD
jgi:hypothetical protein